MLWAMRILLLCVSLAFACSTTFAQGSVPAFDVASVKLCPRTVGPDYNNQFTYAPGGLTARNATLKRLIAEAYGLQITQVSGAKWLDQDEYNIDAKATGPITKEQIDGMLRGLLAERFNLTVHSVAREMRVYELIGVKSGIKIYPVEEEKSPNVQSGFHFHGDMRQFADLLTIQFSIPAAIDPSQQVRAGGPQIPVVDKTGLRGTFDFSVDIHPELGTDAFTLWQRALQAQLGLSIESRKENLGILVVDSAARTPSPN